MELDLHDAIRLHRIVEICADGVGYLVEPHELSVEGGKTILHAYALRGPAVGWVDFADWSDLKITKEAFGARDRSLGT